MILYTQKYSFSLLVNATSWNAVRNIHNTSQLKKSRVILPMKKLSEKKLRYKFVDYMRVRVKGGDGGNGCIAFTSLPHKEWAGPDGGDGGNGGHVVIEVDTNTSSLSKLRRVISGQNGVNGRSRSQHGRNADHTILQVPVGTMVVDPDGKQIIAELNHPNEQFILCRGGAGGRGNEYFLSNEVRAPAYAEEGGKGQEKSVILEMRIMAKVGLIGFPNAGKSTILTALSRATPKIADYPFTTLNPHIGMVQYADREQISVADIPGLIKDSHLNRGLGITFLRHIQRCTCLIYVLDMSEANTKEKLELLKYELEKFQPHLSKRPHALVANKMDLLESEENLDKLRSSETLPIIPISALKRTNIEELKQQIRMLVERYSDGDDLPTDDEKSEECVIN